mmetsp:Transcript_12883/g.36686  ORF Transcript_12883/g.36686 Transcript_12883/m.36686 type:complete len:604 (-) Transcript_12883:243-2054(-)
MALHCTPLQAVSTQPSRSCFKKEPSGYRRAVLTAVLLGLPVSPVVAKDVDTAPAASPPSFAQKVERLQAWLNSLGGWVSPGVGVAEHALSSSAAAEGSDRGLVATQDLAAGERLLLVPRSAHVSHILAAKDGLAADARSLLEAERERCAQCRDAECWRPCQVVSEVSAEALQQIVIAIWLARELKEPTSFYRPWLDLLPRPDVDGDALLLLPEGQLAAALKGTELLREVLDLQQSWRLAHAVLSKSRLYAEHVGTYDAFASARVLVLSRTHGRQDTDTLVPMADLLNHNPDPPTSWHFDSATGDFLLYALRPLPRGTPIECSYGSTKSNSELFIHYGFVLPHNPAHSVPLGLELADAHSDPLQAAKRGALMEMDFYRVFRYGLSTGFAASGPPLRSLVSQDTDGQDDGGDLGAVMLGEALAFIRIAVLTVADLEAQPDGLAARALLAQDAEALETLRAAHAALSPELEERAAASLAASCEAALASMCSGAECGAGAVADAMRRAAAPATGSESPASAAAALRHVAAAAVKHVALERLLYEQLRDVARAVERQLGSGLWLQSGGPDAGLGEGLDEPSQRLLQSWRADFERGFSALGRARERGEL